MNKELQLTPPFQLQQMLDYVKQGKANLLADVTSTSERSTYLAFSDPYIETPAVVIYRKDHSVKWEDKMNKDLKIAVGKGYGVVSFLKDKYPDAIYLELDSDSEVLKSVAFGASDVGVLDIASLSYLLQKTPLSNIEIKTETGFNYSLAFAVSVENKDIIPLINDAIASITQDEKRIIYDKWLSDFPRDNKIEIPRYLYGIAVLTILLLLGLFFTVVIFRFLLTKKTKDLNFVNANLDKLVQQKTKEVENLKNKAESKNKDLENTQKAIVNILEDIQEEKEKLTKVSEN